MNVLDIIRETSARETTRFSFELLPPLKGDGTRSVFTTIEALREFDPAFINVTFHRESIKETLPLFGHKPLHKTCHKAVEAGRAVVSGEIDIGHLLHLIDVGEEILRAGADDDVGAAAMPGEPFCLGIDRGCADAAGHEEHTRARQFVGREVEQVGGAPEGAGEVSEGVAHLQSIDFGR